MLDLVSGGRTRFTFSKNVYSPAVWSPDGARIAYAAGSLGDTIYEKPAYGLGDEQVLLREPGLRHFPTSWSRDGFLLYHTENAPNTGYDLWALSLTDRKPHLMLGGAFNEWAGVFSPDMRWVAYVSNEPGAAGVYVRPFRVRTDRPAVIRRGQAAGLEGLGQLAAVAHRPRDRLQHGSKWNGGFCGASEHHRYRLREWHPAAAALSSERGRE
jgi:Tol biopolymer transport system component